jgi:glycosyltransferase involved in cell wall biosynthesis
MSSGPRVSVLLTAYNREAFVAQSIESVLNQSFEDFELIIVDDASTDNTFDVINAYVGDPRIRIIRNQTNLGDYPNRNFAASLARGEFIKYHDSDDLMYPYCLERMVIPLIAETRAEFAITAGRAWPGGPVPMLSTPVMSFERELFGNGMFFGGPACGLFRRRFFEAVGGFPEEGSASDYVFWLKVCSTANALLVATDLFFYRTHSGQELRSANAEESGTRAHGRMWNLLKSSDCALKGERLIQARREWVKRITRLCVRDVLAGDPGFALYRFSRSEISLREWLRYIGFRSGARYAVPRAGPDIAA